MGPKAEEEKKGGDVYVDLLLSTPVEELIAAKEERKMLSWDILYTVI